MVSSERAQVIACGGGSSDGTGFTAAIVDGDKLLMWGNGQNAVLGSGDGSSEGRDVPGAVPGLADKAILHVALGGKHSAAITEEGKLYTWGSGFCGQLGHGSGEDKPLPTLVEGPLAGFTVRVVPCCAVRPCVCFLSGLRMQRTDGRWLLERGAPRPTCIVLLSDQGGVLRGDTHDVSDGRRQGLLVGS